jgi:hypothetical protein
MRPISGCQIRTHAIVLAEAQKGGRSLKIHAGPWPERQRVHGFCVLTERAKKVAVLGGQTLIERSALAVATLRRSD